MEIQYLDDLEDILDEIMPKTSNELLESDNFHEFVMELIDDYVRTNIITMMNDDFHEALFDDIFHLVICQFEEQLMFYDYEDCKSIIETVVDDYFKDDCPERTCCEEDRDSYSAYWNSIPKRVKSLRLQIKTLRSKPQPEQRTAEWYKFRHNLITASSAYKALLTGAEYNQIIYEKCQPLTIPEKKDDIPSPTVVNVDTTLHWGQKFEPVSVMLYEYMYCTKIEDFGCIQHDVYDFLGASPDGINIDINNPDFYGRMLEIKNIVNREITGIPKMEYWVQMQLQMETCGLNECDFFETRFKEYENEDEYFGDSNSNEHFTVHINSDDVNDKCYKGVIMYFSQNGKPVYKYSPININKEDFEKWETDMHEEMDNSSEESISWIRNIYWYLEEYSCVLVLRNKSWFDAAIPILTDTWEVISKERETGYQHRAPAKRGVKKNIETSKSGNNDNGCLLHINQTTGDVVKNTGPLSKFIEISPKIRTESIDESRERYKES